MEVTEDTTNEDAAVDQEEIRDPHAVLEALERAKSDAKKYRERAEEIEAANKALEERLSALEGDETVSRLKSQLIDISAKKELVSKGIKDVDRILGLMDAGQLDLDSEGRLVGFEESLSALREKLPEVFDDKKRLAGAADAFDKQPVKQKLSSTEAQVKRIFGH
jgi:predicted nuclease with TOPRIM domain